MSMCKGVNLATKNTSIQVLQWWEENHLASEKIIRSPNCDVYGKAFVLFFLHCKHFWHVFM